MKLISTKAHGALDYIISIALIAAPWYLTSPAISDGAGFLRTMGVITLIYSLLTNYEWSFFKVIPFKMHLVLDILVGLTLIGSAFYFDQYPAYGYPHLYIGIVEMFVALASFNYAATTKKTLHRTAHHIHKPATRHRVSPS